MSARYHNAWHYIAGVPEVVDRTGVSRFSGGLSGSMLDASSFTVRCGGNGSSDGRGLDVRDIWESESLSCNTSSFRGELIDPLKLSFPLDSSLEYISNCVGDGERT